MRAIVFYYFCVQIAQRFEQKTIRNRYFQPFYRIYNLRKSNICSKGYPFVIANFFGGSSEENEKLVGRFYKIGWSKRGEGRSKNFTPLPSITYEGITHSFIIYANI